MFSLIILRRFINDEFYIFRKQKKSSTNEGPAVVASP